MYLDWPLLRRWCFCIPLRQGILIFGYMNIAFCIFMIGLFSYTLKTRIISKLLVLGLAANYGRALNIAGQKISSIGEELSIAIYCIELAFDVALLYGVHTRTVVYIKAYYYFTLTLTASTVSLLILDMVMEKDTLYMLVQLIAYTLVGLFMQLYLITAVRSLLKKIETSEADVYDNQLHRILTHRANSEYNTKLINEND